MIEVDIAKEHDVLLDDWRHSGVRLLNAGTEGSLGLRLSDGLEWEATLEINADHSAELLRLDRAFRHSITLRLPRTPKPVVLDAGRGFKQLRLEGGNLKLEGGGAFTIQSLQLVGCSLESEKSLKVDILVLEGDSSLSGQSSLVAHVTIVGGRDTPAFSAVRGKHRLGEIQSQVPVDSETEPWIRSLMLGPGEFTVDKVDSGINVLTLHGASFHLDHPIRAVSELTIAGYGEVHLGFRTRCHHIRFEPQRQGGTLPLEVSLSPEARLTEACGLIRLGHVGRSAMVEGAFDDPLSIESIAEISGGAELEHVDLAGLPLADLNELETAVRVSPWIPSRRSMAVKIESAEGRWKLPTSGDRLPSPLVGQTLGRWRLSSSGFKRRVAELVEQPKAGRFAMVKRSVLLAWLEPFHIDLARRRRIAARWRSLSGIVVSKDGSGSAQSRARYAAMHWRRKALPWRWGTLREKVLLVAYWAVGYGERIGRPLAVFAVFVLAVTLVQSGLGPSLDPGNLLEEWWTLLQQPLSLLRVSSGPLAGTTEPIVYPVTRVVGIVCITFAVLATRRLSRAE